MRSNRWKAALTISTGVVLLAGCTSDPGVTSTPAPSAADDELQQVLAAIDSPDSSTLVAMFPDQAAFQIEDVYTSCKPVTPTSRKASTTFGDSPTTFYTTLTGVSDDGTTPATCMFLLFWTDKGTWRLT